jgi:serine protease Do
MNSQELRSRRRLVALRWIRGTGRAAAVGVSLVLLPLAAHAQETQPPAAPAQQPAHPQNLTHRAQRETQVPLQSLHPIVTRVLPAVVNVSVTMKSGAASGESQAAPNDRQGAPTFPQSPFDEFLRRFFGEPGMGPGQGEPQLPGSLRRVALGSGFIIDPSGYIVTNYHVVEQAASVTVVFQDNSRHPAKVIGRDAKTDLALLKIDTDRPLPYLTWGDSNAAQVGDWVMAVGNPFGLGGSVTAGIISARGRDIQSGPYDDFLQIDAPINRGNSGGPTFNMAAEVIGINTAIYSPSGGSVGIGFAIPASLAKPVIDQLKAHGKVERGWLGVQIQHVTPEIAKSLGMEKDHGALVANVSPSSPAAKAGVKQGDVIVSYDGHQIEQPRDLSIAVAESAIGKPETLTVWRDGKDITLNPTIAEMPQNLETASKQPSRPPAPPKQESALGMQLAPLTDDLRQQLSLGPDAHGAVVTNVSPDSPAANDIQPGDVIQSVNRQPVNTPAEAVTKLKDATKSGKKNVLILLNRQGSNEYVGLAVG